MHTTPHSFSNKLLLDIYNASNHHPLTVHHKNGTSTVLSFTPVCKTHHSFKQNGEKHVDEMIKNMCSHDVTRFENNDTYLEEYSSAQKVIKHLSSKYPASFECVTKDRPNIDNRLNKYETSALIEYMDITEYVAYEKFNRFFRSTKGFDILAPKRQLDSFKDDAPTTRIYTATVDCSTKKSKQEETVHGIETNLHDHLRTRVQMHLNEDPSLFNTNQPTDQSTPMFGYDNPGDASSILGVIGTDHGQAHSQFQLAVHLLPSQARREKNDKVHGILTIPFSTIQCKKENSNILVLATPQINASIKMLEKNKLMGVRKGGMTHCFWMHKDATNVKIECDIPCQPRVRYSVAGSVYTQCLPYNCEATRLELFTILAPLHFVVVCDLSAMLALMGRDGMAPNKCLKCDCRIHEWKKERGKVGLDLTMELLEWMLQNKNSPTMNRAGMKVHPLFDLPPERYLCPILHLLLGLINDVMTKGVIPFALRMDGCTDAEREIREELETGVSAKRGKTLRARLKKLVLQRTSNTNGTDTEIRNQLTKFGLYFENYHGGTLNGNNCQILCQKAREMMNECKEICKKRLETQTRNGTLQLYSPTVTECDVTFEKLTKVLEIADVVFSGCNLIAPTEEEISELEESIEYLEECWYDAGLSETPKAHLVFRHLIWDITQYKGLGDKQEQELERRHQLQKKWTNRLRCMRDSGNRLKKQYEYEWRMGHPRVERILAKVDNPTRKRKESPLTLKEENEVRRSMIKKERRDGVVRMLRLEDEE